MFYSCGAQGIYRTSPLVRAFVDIHSGRTHIANNPGLGQPAAIWAV
jgi:3-hydroxy-9,10-secoandrosta-1,3,5(10)-triene-9,17-dione monooxygenase